MKKLISASIVLVAMLIASTNVNAQNVSNNSVSLDSWETVKLSYTPTTLENDHPSFDWDLNGFSFEYLKGVNIVDNKPIFLEYGVGSEILIRKDKSTTEGYHYDYENGYEEYNIYNKSTTTVVDFYVPVNVGYKLALKDGVTIMPYVGIKAQCNIFGRSVLKTKKEGSSESKKEVGNLFNEDDTNDHNLKRFLFSWYLGATIEKDMWSIGIRHGKCFSDKIMNNTESELMYTSVSVGYYF